MYANENYQNSLNYLAFLCEKRYEKCENNFNKIIYSEISHKEINIYKINFIILNTLKMKKYLKFKLLMLTLSSNNKRKTNNTYKLDTNSKNNLIFYSDRINSSLIDYTNKNNFVTLRISNISLYLSLKKYLFVFSENKEKISLNEFTIANVFPTFQEITEIKPDKTKKIFFKKKQVKIFTYFNELNKNYTYIDDEDVDAKIMEKDLFIKNIFINTISDKFENSLIFENKKIFSNKSIGFWKKSRHISVSSGIVLYQYAVNKYLTQYVFQMHVNTVNSISTETSPLDFDLSANFLDSTQLTSDKLEFYKNIFLYNFMNLFSKVTDINYNQKYTYFNHIPEFKDYFFKKNNPLSRDLIVHNYKNKNKFNNFFPLYCLSFKKFKKLILFSKKQQSPVYSAYYMYYLVNFLELMCKKKIWIRINTKKQVSDEIYNKFTALFLKNRADQVNIGKHFFLIEFYEIIYLSFINRDIAFFATWFKKIMEKIHLKKHRKMVKIVHSTIRNNLMFLELTNIKGFSMDVRGKLGTAGNSKKKHYAFTVGSIAPTTKAHGLNLYQTTVRTSTGVLGVTILMAY